MLLAVTLALTGTALLVGGVDARALHAKPLDWAISFSSAAIFAFYILYSKRGIARYRCEPTRRDGVSEACILPGHIDLVGATSVAEDFRPGAIGLVAVLIPQFAEARVEQIVMSF